MASRNELKPKDAQGALFHVYNRGINGELIFRDGNDYAEFLSCFRRHLCLDRVVDSHFRPYRKLHDVASVIALCLMPNHFHLVIRQKTATGMESLMRAAMIGYSKRFNAKHGRYGPLFQGRYKAALIDSHQYARQAITYVHLNHPVQGIEYRHTTHLNYLGERHADWIDAADGLRLYGGRPAYQDHIAREIARRKADV